MKKRKHTVPREYPPWLDDYGALVHDARLGNYPPNDQLEWHATIYDYNKYCGESDERKYGVNIFSDYWGLCCSKKKFEDAMNVINDFQIDHKIPSSNYKVHIQYRPEKVKKDAMQMKLFTTFEMTGGDYEREA